MKFTSFQIIQVASSPDKANPYISLIYTLLNHTINLIRFPPEEEGQSDYHSCVNMAQLDTR